MYECVRSRQGQPIGLRVHYKKAESLSIFRKGDTYSKATCIAQPTLQYRLKWLGA